MQGFPKGVRSAAHPPALDKSCENCVSLFLELMVQFVYEDDEAAAGTCPVPDLSLPSQSCLFPLLANLSRLLFRG